MQNIVDEEYHDDSNFGYNNALGLEWRCSIMKEDGSTANYDQLTMQYWYWNNENSSFKLIYNNADEAWNDINHYKEALGITEENTLAESFYQPYAMQSSFVLMDQRTGEVKAIQDSRMLSSGSGCRRADTGQYKNGCTVHHTIRLYPEQLVFRILGIDYGT